MLFLNRTQESQKLDSLIQRSRGGFAVIYGRRRVGKTRLLVEWSKQHQGVYFVADESASAVQRAYFADELASKFNGFAEAAYPDWRALLRRLAVDATAKRFRGPIIIDELPYLVKSSPELPSILQQWLDHEAKRAGLAVVVAGSSQRMMQGLALDPNAPLYGRADVIMELSPLSPMELRNAFPAAASQELLDLYTAWGGIPRYWELASEHRGRTRAAVLDLVLDPLGVLHDEPTRLLLEETPPATELRPLLDSIGAGAHRVTEIGARIERPATSLARSLERLQGMALVDREVPFGTSEKETKRSLYKIADPFLRLWFRVVAPHRGRLRVGAPRVRAELLEKHWSSLRAIAWEELCRRQLPHVAAEHIGARTPFLPAQRWWQGNHPEWDIVSQSEDGKVLLLGEARAHVKTPRRTVLESECVELAARRLPILGKGNAIRSIARALFVPEIPKGMPREHRGVFLVSLSDLL